MFKKFARYILRKEIAYLKKQRDDYRNDFIEWSDKYSLIVGKHADEIAKYKNEIASLMEKLKNSEEENNILREYYHLDQEPSEDVQSKVLLNIRCHDLEREITNLKIQALENSRQSHYFQKWLYVGYPQMWQYRIL